MTCTISQANTGYLNGLPRNGRINQFIQGANHLHGVYYLEKIRNDNKVEYKLILTILKYSKRKGTKHLGLID